MAARIGIRREDKNDWERRVPLTPSDAASLIKDGYEIWLQPSKIRTFPDKAYEDVGAVVSEDLSSCPLIIALKEIPNDFFEPNKTYLFFSHTIKGQSYNMAMLRKMMDLKCQLLDYELVADDKGRRLIFFGNYAGFAGMIDTLWALGKRYESEGIPNALSDVKRAYDYDDLEDAKAQIKKIGERIAADGLPASVTPLICGFAGYGNVSQGAQEIFNLLPHEEVSPQDIAKVAGSSSGVQHKLFKVVFKENDLVETVNSSAKFELQDYYDHPEKYKSQFENYLPYLTILMNCIYWEEQYPRLVTLDYLKRTWSDSDSPMLKVIGDITCDIGGSVECTFKATEPGTPVYVYNPLDGKSTDGYEGAGLVMMTVDNLPGELAKESSGFFSNVLLPFVPDLAKVDTSVPYEKLNLPPPLYRAIILHQGELTPDHKHLSKLL